MTCAVAGIWIRNAFGPVKSTDDGLCGCVCCTLTIIDIPASITMIVFGVLAIASSPVTAYCLLGGGIGIIIADIVFIVAASINNGSFAKELV